MIKKWDIRFMTMAKLVATWSKDPKRKVGAVLVTPNLRQIAIGYNGFPKNTLDHDSFLENKKYRLLRTMHAELNAICNANFPPNNCTLYIANNFPCNICAQVIIQVGISRVIANRHPDTTHNTWGEVWQCALDLMKEANIEIDVIKNGL